MTRRRRAREIAVQSCYQAEYGQDSAREALGQILERRRVGERVTRYACILVDLVSENAEAVDGAIHGVLEHWRLGRLAAIDRSILRVATAEILYLPEIPTEVIIDEAVEIAKKYSTEHSGSFVNGVLDRLARVSSRGGPSADLAADEPRAEEGE